MDSPLSFDRLILFTTLWWVFSTVVAFIAATVLWKLGSAQVAGKIPGMENIAFRFTGAGALWCFTLLLFCTVRPDVLKPHKQVMLIYTRPDPLVQPKGEDFIEVKNLDLDLSGTVTYELIRRDGVFALLEGDKGRLEFDRPIPAGAYELRITDPRKDAKEKYRSLSVKIPHGSYN